ncbi:unnamed protein product [Microthlaspi erraticum]|uniref:Uncharacterized protein n=1 Tax=Microthlaspi erraticum TaxID=1685480 RepID=A0A6D2I8M3_9BRAS|nr:unnamed protein product [Microthlaspi erraticum]
MADLKCIRNSCALSILLHHYKTLHQPPGASFHSSLRHFVDLTPSDLFSDPGLHHKPNSYCSSMAPRRKFSVSASSLNGVRPMRKVLLEKIRRQFIRTVRSS